MTEPNALPELNHADATRDARAILGRHLSPEQITDGAAGSLDAATAAGIYSHLAACADCAELVRLAGEGLARLTVAGVEPHVPMMSARRIRAAVVTGGLGIAAGWLAAVLWIDPRALDSRLRETEQRVSDLQTGTTALERRLAQAAGPRVNVRTVDVFPDSLARRSAPGGAEITSIARGSGDLILVLNSQAPDRPGPFPAALIDATGKVVWQTDALARQSQREFTVQFPQNFLAPGVFELRLLRPGSDEPLETYRFRIS